MTVNEDAAAAFGILSDPTRIAILRAFARALEGGDVDSSDPFPALPFSEVYDRVDVDSTSQLSYHLEQLDGTYLRRTDDGWTFTFAGESVVRLVLSGAYGGDVAFDPVPVDTPCPICGAGQLCVAVEDRLLFRECEDCGRRMGGLPVTPAQVRDRDADAVLASVTTRMLTRYWRFREDACPDCGGAVTIDLQESAASVDTLEWTAVGRCLQCRRSIHGPPSIWLVTHPASIAFHWDRGIDVRSFGFAALTERVTACDWNTTRVAPEEFRVTYRLEDARLRLTVDETLAVSSIARVRTAPSRDR
ncbi:winged helix-turn-helix domain-containing protein [Natronococcus occultus]|uniref:Uncharacterized protein n=1 Tax=Natronococcus occultus SP4 TaxID=694430 RepID=L0K2X4_9EURY|nr:helix-turn-helix domain-containing protein [Natronococcus occultus]AGB38709.1 hypothetical protein Natoc_2954 [Natronococcus occultus SP4]